MKTKKVITSIFAMAIVVPAMAAPSNTDTFPTGGLMQADYTYTNAATETNMDGVYEGSVNANAQYTDALYTVTAGTYLPISSETTATCTAGNYCPGLQSQVNYSTTTNQGLNACPTVYANSAAGASANTECYRACATSDVAHSASVLGQMYYDGTSGDGVSACEPETCVHGYHVKAATPDLMTLIGVSEAGTGYVSNNSTGAQANNYGGMTSSGAGISNDPMAFAVDYGNKGIIKGHGRCSTRAGTNTWTNNTYNVIDSNFVDTLADETGTGEYCYCQLDGYTPLNGQSQSLSSIWVFSNDFGRAGGCANDCALNCASALRRDYADYLAYRAAVFNTIQSSPAMCEANTITINWDGADTADITANNAGTTVYDGDVRTPVKAVHIPGKRFTGWLFSNPNKE